MDWLVLVVKETAFFFNEVAIYLILGFAIAAVLHVLFPESIIRRHFGQDSFASVFKATLFGIPLPICSCGVVPVAASLRRGGASRGATASFLIATPQVGADSFMITYSLLGWVFGVFRIIAAMITALLAGILVNIFKRQKDTEDAPSARAAVKETLQDRIRTLPHYIEYELLGPIASALLIGILIAGIISALIPDNFFDGFLGGEVTSLFVMLIIGIPMYVCASASTPIAASLILKGLSPGAALVFLLTGPATNAMSIATVLKILGKRATFIYLASIAGVSLALGFALNWVVGLYGLEQVITTHQHDMLPMWLKLSGSALLLFMLAWYYMTQQFPPKTSQEQENMSNKMSLTVNGMTCPHCAANVKRAVENVGGSQVQVDLEAKQVDFALADASQLEQVKAEIKAAGYELV